jgi:N-acetyl-anhydromuramyl-L-alanine amidase AmpD
MASPNHPPIVPSPVRPEYPGASRFISAAPGNYKRCAARKISRIVLHITDGGPNISGTIAWFCNPAAKVSAHYIVGQDGAVVQMVRHRDVAWHAGKANGDSIGIEHVGNTRGLAITELEYRASADLVRWLCATLVIPIDRLHIIGHCEVDKATTHKGCPNSIWDWTTYMERLVAPAIAVKPVEYFG